MSVQVLTAFLEHSRSTLGARLVGIVMADVSGDDGICWLDQRKIMARAKLSERGVRDAIRTLEELGEIETRQAQRGARRINVYRLWCSATPDYDRLPFDVREPFTVRPADVAGADDRQISPVRPADLDHDDRQIAASTPSSERKKNTKEHEPRWTVDRKRVTEAEQELAGDVLAAWNEATSQTLSAKEWLAMIVRRHREHPELDLVDHVAVIAANLNGDRWWSGPPSPSILYGSGAQFERSLTAWQHPTTTTEVRAAEERSRFARILGGG